MEPLEAAKTKPFRALTRERAEGLAAAAGYSLDPKRHPELEGIEGLRAHAGLALLEEFDADAYYESILPWYRSHDRAKEHVLSHFESLCGRLPASLRERTLHAIGTGVRLRGLCARDSAGNRWFVPVEETEAAREVRLSASEQQAYERARKAGGLSELPTLA